MHTVSLAFPLNIASCNVFPDAVAEVAAFEPVPVTVDATGLVTAPATRLLLLCCPCPSHPYSLEEGEWGGTWQDKMVALPLCTFVRCLPGCAATSASPEGPFTDPQDMNKLAFENTANCPGNNCEMGDFGFFAEGADAYLIVNVMG